MSRDSSVVIGIDPGMSGGIALLSRRTGNLVDCMRMPLLDIGKRQLIDVNAISDMVSKLDVDWPVSVHIVLEAVHSMPAQGVASTFKFGRAAGSVEAWALRRAGNTNVSFVSPRKWKGDLKLTSDKRSSLAMAALLWPEPPGTIKGKPVSWDVLRNDGIAEAALVAHHWLNH